jgi:hypothetical protein
MAARSLDYKRTHKLKKVNVPELMFAKFMNTEPIGKSAIADKLRNIAPTPRGRGMSRVLTNLTSSEWEELYAYAAHGRKVMQGANRATELKPAICAKSLAYRMEALGVATAVSYTPSKTRTRATTVVLTDDDIAMDHKSHNVVPATPITISRVELDEMDTDEQQAVHTAMKNHQL